MAAVPSVPEALEILKSSIDAAALDAGNRNFGVGLLGGLLISAAVLLVSQKKMPTLPKMEDVHILCSIFVAVGTLGFYFIDEQETLVDSFYCSCITLSTVGYGDICPKSDSVAIKAFISVFALCGLGVFCNQLLGRTASWTEYLKTLSVEDGFHAFSVLLVVIGLSAGLFMTLEGWSFADASYFSIITGTTIGYGDHPPFTTAAGKIAAAVFAMLSIEAVGLVTTVMKIGLSKFLHFATPDSEGEYQFQWKGVLAFAAGLVLVGTIGFVVLDGQASVVDGFYCSCITVSTVGYGDICPSSGTITMKVFVVVLALGGLGIFGEFLGLSQKWADYIPVHQAIGSLAACVVASIALFTTLEGWSIIDAAYFSIITGTTIGYGDVKPETSLGKIATAVFAVLSINVVGDVTVKVGDQIRDSVANLRKQDKKEKTN